jgi:hypothetical protein
LATLALEIARRPDQISLPDAKDLLRSEGLEIVGLGGERPPEIGVSPRDAVDNASSTFAAFAPQEPEVHLILIAENLDEPEFTGPFYAFQLEGLGPGPVLRSEPRRYLVLVDAEDGSRTMGFPLDR